MEVGAELEDDLFFADLSKQISLLIMDEDEDPIVSCPADSLQSFSGAIYPPPESAFLHDQAFMRRQSKGTGVFIPQSTQRRRKHKKGRSSSNAKYQKQSQDTRRISQTPAENSFKPRN